VLLLVLSVLQVGHHLLCQCGLSISMRTSCRGSTGWWLCLGGDGTCGCAELLWLLVHLWLLVVGMWCIQGHACHGGSDPGVPRLGRHPEPVLTAHGEGAQQDLPAGHPALGSCGAHGLVQVGSDPVCEESEREVRDGQMLATTKD
jgi:hypothetical protein